MSTSRPPPFVLLIHDARVGPDYVHYLTAAGFRVAELSAREHDGDLIEQTIRVAPDIIVLDYTCNGDTVMRLKADARTAPLPILALAELVRIGRSPASSADVAAHRSS